MSTKIKNKKILAIIPARGGSKGLPGKNIKKLAGKPLIAWTIEQAKKSKYLDRIIVSTEDKKIKQVAEKWGAETIKRPKKLARDETKMTDVLLQSLNFLKKENYKPEIIVLLQPTSPLRSAKDIDIALEIFLKKKADSLISLWENTAPPYWSFKINKQKYLTPLFNWNYFQKRRQDLPKSYLPNGAIFIVMPEILLKNKSFYTNKTIPYIMPAEKSIDIDNEIDFQLVNLIIKNEKYQN